MADLSHLLDLDGRVALVTGASRGIGAATARRLAEAGAHVALVSRSESALGEIADTLPDGYALVMPTDISQDDEVDRTVEAIRQTWGPVDILVNNAGEMAQGRYSEVDIAAWQRMLDINLTGTYRLVRAVGPDMETSGWGRIVMITSVTAQTGGVSGGAHYSASKGGMAALTKTLARDLAPSQVTVNAIAPGQIDTSPELLTDEQRDAVLGMIPLGRLGSAIDIANAVLFLTSELGSYVTGATIDVNGGVLKR